MSRRSGTAMPALACVIAASATLAWAAGVDHLAGAGTVTVALTLLTVSVAALRGAADRWAGVATSVLGVAAVHLWLIASTGPGCEPLLDAGSWLDRARGAFAASCLGAGDAATLSRAPQWAALATTAVPLLALLLGLAGLALAPGSASALLAALGTGWVADRIRPVVAPTVRTAQQVIDECARAPRQPLGSRLVERRGPPCAFAAA